MTDDQLDAAIATLEDEEAAHRDTLRLWRETKAKLTRAEKVIAAARHLRAISEWDPVGLEALGARNLFDQLLAEYDRPAALPVTREDGNG